MWLIPAPGRVYRERALSARGAALQSVLIGVNRWLVFYLRHLRDLWLIILL
jgi:hypothetical protein